MLYQSANSHLLKGLKDNLPPLKNAFDLLTPGNMNYSLIRLILICHYIEPYTTDNKGNFTSFEYTAIGQHVWCATRKYHLAGKAALFKSKGYQ